MEAELLKFGLVLRGPTDEHALPILASCLSAFLPWKVVADPFPTPLELTLAFGRGEVDLVWSSPALALTSPALREAVPVASSLREGRAHYHAILFVRSESSIRSAMHLKGARAVWVAESSASGHIFPKVALAGFGLDPQQLFLGERFVGSHGAVVEAVESGEADVGATYATFEGGVATGELLKSGVSDTSDPERFRVLLATPPIPADLLLLRRKFELLAPNRVRGAFNAVGTATPEAVTTILGTERFAPVNLSSLEELRRQLADAKELGVPLL
ncbi:MAG: PhnD/SsuA/transferrin family substrate-binding protein [Myxococcota bacterium]